MMWKLMQTRRLVIRKHPEVYDISDDTTLLADNLTVNDDDKVLEVCSGSGYVSLVAAQKAKYVVGIDINPHAVKLAKLNARLNNILNVEFVLGDLFSPIRAKFNLITINPPYLQGYQGMNTNNHSYLDYSWNGGEDGRSVTERFLAEVEEYLEASGRIFIVQSSLSGYDKTVEELSKEGFLTRIIAEKKLFFETLYLIEAT
jgi:release factor glutamine methyltransferase